MVRKLGTLALCAAAFVLASSDAGMGAPGGNPGPTIFFYQLDFPGTLNGYFPKCTGLGSQSKPGTGTQEQRRSKTRVAFVDLVCARGLTSAMDLWNWRSQVEQGEPAQKDGTFSILDDTGHVVAQWHLTQASPREVTLGDDGSEMIVLQYEDEKRIK